MFNWGKAPEKTMLFPLKWALIFIFENYNLNNLKILLFVKL
jgi:hypothetical protein